jgi:hypothetical protein
MSDSNGRPKFRSVDVDADAPSIPSRLATQQLPPPPIMLHATSPAVPNFQSAPPSANVSLPLPPPPKLDLKPRTTPPPSLATVAMPPPPTMSAVLADHPPPHPPPPPQPSDLPLEVPLAEPAGTTHHDLCSQNIFVPGETPYTLSRPGHCHRISQGIGLEEQTSTIGHARGPRARFD